MNQSPLNKNRQDKFILVLNLPEGIKNITDQTIVEVVTFSALKETYEKAKDPYEREHVLPYVWRRPEHFNLGSIVNKVDLSDKRWTVDEQADFNMISIIYEELYKDNQEFNTPDILDFLLKRPEVEKINASIGVASSIINQ